MSRIKHYTEDELKQIISKKYHSMIDWESTMFCGFDGSIQLIDNGQSTKCLYPSLYDCIKNVNWYLREIKAHPEVEW